MSGKHAKLSASISKRWMSCPGSIRLCVGIPNTGSVYAAEGTAAHKLAEVCLKTNTNASGYLKKKVEGFEVTEDMADAVQVYLDEIRKDMKTVKGAKLMIEQHFKLSIHPDMQGTNDACLCEPYGKLIVYDYKHGAGVAVDAEANSQLAFYALGAIETGDYAEVILKIVQPRAFHSKGKIRTWNPTKAELEKWKADFLKAAKEVAKPDAPLCSGDHCKFCPAAAKCPELHKKSQAVARAVFAPEVKEAPAPELLTIEEVASVLDKADMVEAWIASVRAHAVAALHKGQAVPGWKLVAKRSTTKWKDEANTEKELAGYKELIYTTPELKSPTQVKKALPKSVHDIVESLTHKPDNGATIAPEADSRPAYRPAIEDVFTNIDESYLD